MSTIYKSGEVIDNLRLAMDRDSAYPFAFGYAWALLSEKARKEIIKMAEAKANEKKAE